MYTHTDDCRTDNKWLEDVYTNLLSRGFSTRVTKPNAWKRMIMFINGAGVLLWKIFFYRVVEKGCVRVVYYNKLFCLPMSGFA